MEEPNTPSPEMPPAESAPPVYGLPPVHEPPPYRQAPPPPSESPFQKRLKKMGPVGAAIAALLAKLKTIWSFLILGAKFAKLGKVAITLGTMLVSIGLYALIFGWQFGVGIVGLIFLHEMGHVFVA